MKAHLAHFEMSLSFDEKGNLSLIMGTLIKYSYTSVIHQHYSK